MGSETLRRVPLRLLDTSKTVRLEGRLNIYEQRYGTLTAVDELVHKALIHRPNPLSFTSARSNRQVRGRSSPASILNPMTMMM